MFAHAAHLRRSHANITALSHRLMSTAAPATATAAPSAEAPEVLFDRKNKSLVVTLNRPKALNALNLTMVREMMPVYESTKQDDSIGHVIIKGAGDKAFCAGGDIKAIAETRDPTFFAEEYQLNQLIGTYPKVCFL
jgi:enoyl-CoA hydratase/carnithine racemase